MDKLAGGIVPKMQEQVKYEEILPWLGFMLSGAEGLTWYSYWIQEKDYGWNKKETNTDHHLTKGEKEKLKNG